MSRLGGTWTFHRRLLLAVDAKGYGGVDTTTQRQFQDAISSLLGEAAEEADLDRSRWVMQKGGDSVFAVLPEGASEPALVDRFMRTLDAGLRKFNHGRIRESWLRLRAAVHFGSASPGSNGFVGPGPVVVGRILDSAALRATLADTPDACLAVAVSPTVFDDVVHPEFTTIRADEFREVQIEEKEHRGTAWIWVPGTAVQQVKPGPPDRHETGPVGPPGPVASNPDRQAVARQVWTQTNTACGSAPQFAVQGGNIVYHQVPERSPRPSDSLQDGSV
ncbi:hypothetical protein [Streptomyces sp. NBC_01451]|uniref:hypothetical protein n=1 Tax=Streptomyces sp. NBC_01451 TaxID=2903872 RepID=UPI002E30B125|nr:hypothetical protein [Streptomyces sp. NBC_01451]